MFILQRKLIMYTLNLVRRFRGNSCMFAAKPKKAKAIGSRCDLYMLWVMDTWNRFDGTGDHIFN